MPTQTTDKFKDKKHGTHSTYSKGCRCEPCTIGHRVYSREIQRRRRRAEQGLEEPIPPQFIDATVAREHLEHLAKHGMGVRTVFQRSGVHKANLQKIRKGQQKLVSPDTERRILNVLVSEYEPYEFIDATYTQQLLDEVFAEGHTLKEINELCNYKFSHQKVVTGKWIQYWKQERMEKLHFFLLRRPPRAVKPAIQKRMHSKK